MESLGFAGFVLGIMLMFWWLSRLMTSTGRNDEGSHGGGPSGGVGM